MQSSTVLSNPHRQKAVVFTSCIAMLLIGALYLVTLYPAKAQPREELVSIDVPLVYVPEVTSPLDNTSSGSPVLGGQKDGTVQKSMAAPVNGEVEINKTALFPGMHSGGTDNEESTGPGKTTIPGTNVRGIHGTGTEDGYVLGNRKCTGKPAPAGNIAEEGTVTVNIWVNEKGQVMRSAISEQLTNTNSPALRKLAMQAALKTTWTEQAGTPEQKGHIVYKFVLH